MDIFASRPHIYVENVWGVVILEEMSLQMLELPVLNPVPTVASVLTGNKIGWLFIS